MLFITTCPESLVVEHWFRPIQPKDQPWEPNVNITFQIKGQGHSLNKLKPFSYKLLVVGSSFHDINTLKSPYPAHVVKSSHIADFNLF